MIGAAKGGVESSDAMHGREVLLYGELVCLDADGRPDSHDLGRRLSVSNDAVS